MGKDCTAMAMINTASYSMSVQMPFLRKNAGRIWTGPVIVRKSNFFNQIPDDDGLLMNNKRIGLGTSRWMTVECAGDRQEMVATINPDDAPDRGVVVLGYGWLRGVRLLFNGPGNTLWVQPSSSRPETQLATQGASAQSKSILERALLSAIEFNDPTTIKSLLAAGAEVNGSPDRWPLVRACEANSREAALTLLEAGALVDRKPDCAVPTTPLIAACKCGAPDLIKMLLAKGADPNKASAAGFTPLMAAARSGIPAAVHELRGKASFPKDPSAALSLLGDACLGGNLMLAKEMLAKLPSDRIPVTEYRQIFEIALLSGH
jgi:hypothetical protein